MVGYYRFGTERVSSEIMLPGVLRAAHDAPHESISIRRGDPRALSDAWRRDPDDGAAEGRAGLGIQRWRSPDGLWRRLRYAHQDHYAEFSVRSDGREIVAGASRDVTDADLGALIEGPILAGALRLMGQPCLHATVLVADGRAIALMGPSGAGKSTLAWALIEQGGRLLSDDVGAFAAGDGGYVAYPARTRLRMRADAVARFSLDGVGLERLHPVVDRLDKLILTDPRMVHPEPARLHAVFRLRPRDRALARPRIVGVSASEALAEFAAHVTGPVTVSRADLAREFATLGGLAAAVPMYGLTLPDDFDALPETARRLQAVLFE